MFIQLAFYDRKIRDKYITSILGGLIPMLMQFSQLNFVKCCFNILICMFFFSFLSSLKADLDKVQYTEYRYKKFNKKEIGD